MVVGSKHALAKKLRPMEIMCIFLGLFVISSVLLTLTSVSRRHHSVDAFNFASGGPLLTFLSIWCIWDLRWIPLLYLPSHP